MSDLLRLLAPVQLSLDGLANELGAAPLAAEGVNPGHHLFRQADLRRLVSQRRSPHARTTRRYRIFRQTVHISDTANLTPETDIAYICGIGYGDKAMSNLPEMSKRAQQALDVLADGGRFVRRLERNSYTGREQFQFRLVRQGAGHYGSPVRGIGCAAFYELQHLGFLQYAHEERSSVVEPYKLRTA